MLSSLAVPNAWTSSVSRKTTETAACLPDAPDRYRSVKALA
jgi:hypothetical protein